MFDIFLSYSRKDIIEAQEIAKYLSSAGYKIWWDASIPPGKRFDDVIQETLDSVKCVIVLWSKNSITSNWVKEEASIGKQRNILIPILIENVEPPLGFKMIQAVNLVNCFPITNKLLFKNLIESIDGLVYKSERVSFYGYTISNESRKKISKLNKKKHLTILFFIVFFFAIYSNL